MIRLTPSMLESVRLYLTTDWMTPERLVASLVERAGVTPEMQAGRLFGAACNSDDRLAPEEMELQEAARECKRIRSELQPGGAWLAEPWSRMVIHPPGHAPALLSGRCDDLCGRTAVEYKLTGRVDLLGYSDSIQWRCYAALFDVTRVVYVVGQRTGREPPYGVGEVTAMPLWADPDTCRVEVERMAAETLRISASLGVLDELQRVAA